MDTSSVLEQKRQYHRGCVQSESAIFPFDESEDASSSVLFELPVTTSSSALAGHLVRLEEGLGDSCLCCLEPVLVSGVKLGVWSSPCVELCSLLTSTSEEVMQVLLMWRQLGESLGEWSCFPFGGMARPAKGHPNKGVPAKGMSGKEDTGGGVVASRGVRTPHGPGTSKPWGSGAVGQGPDMMETPLILLSGSGCSLTYIAERDHHRNAPGQ